VYVNRNFHQAESAGVLLIHPKAFRRNVKGGNSFTIRMPLWIQFNFRSLCGGIFKRSDSRISPPIINRARQSWMLAEGAIRGEVVGRSSGVTILNILPPDDTGGFNYVQASACDLPFPDRSLIWLFQIQPSSMWGVKRTNSNSPARCCA
jgi:hypothetical protein